MSKKHWIRKEDKVSLNYKHELTLFAQWYLRQKFTYEMLKQTGAEIYQWLLEPKYILEELLNAVDEDMIHTEWQQNKSQAFECAYSLLKQKHTGWENLLECPEIEARHYESKKKAKGIEQISFAYYIILRAEKIASKEEFPMRKF